ncbi:MAG: porin [Thermodesulfobacteriota bacterium]
MKKFAVLISFLAFMCIASAAQAVSMEVQGFKLGINGYVDLQYNYMSKAPMSDGSIMSESSAFRQEQFNLLFDAEKERYRAHINLQAEDTFTSEDGGKGVWKLQEAYGEYRFNDLLDARAGFILTPFGIYNEVSYITSLYASVVLPFIYELPEGYSGNRIVPDNSNVVVSGNYLGDNVEVNYNLFISNGRREASGEDMNKDKGLGTRVRLTFLDDYKIGASYYTVQNDKTTEGREQLLGIDIEMNLRNLLLQGEIVKDIFSKKFDRLTYYARLTYEMGKLSPFVMYDYFEDPNDLVWKNKQSRYGVGASYDISRNVILKGEYHYHNFANDAGLPQDTDTVQMLRAAVIFIF